MTCRRSRHSSHALTPKASSMPLTKTRRVQCIDGRRNHLLLSLADLLSSWPDWALRVAEEARARALAFRLGAGVGDAGGAGQDSTSHPLHILGKYMNIVRNSAWSDLEKTSTLTPLLRHEEDCNASEVKVSGTDMMPRLNFTGIPDW